MQKKTRSQDKYVLFRLCFVAYPFLFVIIISIFCMYWLRLYFLNWIKQFTTSAIIPTKACCLSRQFAYLYHFQWCVMQKISLSLSLFRFSMHMLIFYWQSDACKWGWRGKVIELEKKTYIHKMVLMCWHYHRRHSSWFICLLCTLFAIWCAVWCGVV